MLCQAIAIIAILSPSATATITPTAQCTCLPNMLPKTASEMVVADGANMSNGSMLGGTYGDSCGVHKELFSSSCVFSNGSVKKDAADWCASPWCWVDPCTCKMSDVARSSYFKADMYYSYSNCGGVDTYTSQQNKLLTASCSASWTPKDECVPRMANDYPLINCSGGIMGQCRKASVSGKLYNYPASYGEGCGIHAEPGHSACSDTSTGAPLKAGEAAWCKQPFSWVNPCECRSSDMAKSTYFPGLYYSYSVCGGNDTYTSSALLASVKEELNCPSPPPPAPVQSPGNYPGADPKDKKCACMPLPASVVPLVNCTTDYAQNGKCVVATKFPGLYPANYGATCGIHMEPLSESCFDLKSGRPWKSACRGDKTSGCRASWCDSAFCFVDPCTCTGVNDIAKTTWFPHANVFYSYENCKGVNTFSNSSEASKSTFKKAEVCGTSCADMKKAYGEQGCCTAPQKMFDVPKSGTMLKLMAGPADMVTKPSGSARRLSAEEAL
eukprot:TRINITY_DN19366_c0_g1_i2.p1 TRINITY_DN19366_c0_g1~~TRINITY_DN19366_c0_g1_i2.p1  ORF type:complete len:497 (+),score=67.10 TRINITY_DN19366_c0_g1_i2:80-1570(+)